MVRRLQRLRYFMILCIIPMLLTGCGAATTGEEKKPVGIMGLGMTGKIMLVLTALVSIVSITKLLTSSTSQKRGTNAASKFIRHNTSYGVQKRTMRLNGLVAALDLIGTVSHFTIPRLFITLLPIGVIVYSFILMRRGTKDKERVEATRTVTKSTVTAAGEVGSKVAYTGATIAAGAAVVGSAPVAAIPAAGAAAYLAYEGHKGSERIRATMEDVDHGREVREYPELSDGRVIDPETFISKAMKLGCDAGMSIQEMADMVLKYAPEASLNELPEEMDPVEKAARLLGAVRQVEAIEDKSEKPDEVSKEPPIDVDFREVQK